MKLSVEWVPGLAIGVGCLASLVMFPDLPGAFSWPYSFAQPLIAFALPATAAVTYLILRRLWGETANERAHEADPEAAHRAIAVCLVFFVVAIHLLILLNLGGAQWVRGWGSRLVVVLFGGVIIATGNLLPRTRPNLAFGIRTALTLSDRRLWIRLHRTTGYVAVALGTIIVFSGAFLSRPTLGMVISAAGLGSIAVLAVTYRRQCSVECREG